MADLCPDQKGEPFTPWILKLIMRRRQFREAGEEEASTRAAIDEGIRALLAAGATHVGDISQTGLSIEPLLDSGLAGVVYLEVIGANREQAMASFARARHLLEKHRPHERNGLRIGLSPHAPYSTHADAFRQVTDYCLREGVPMCIHLAESPAEIEAFSGRGPFFDLAEKIGADVSDLSLPAGVSPTAYLDSLGVLDARPLLVHVVQVSDADLDLLARSGAKVAHCPRSNRLLQCGRMPLEKMLARNIPVALGSDSLASSPSLDVREEAKAAIILHGNHVPAAAITALRSNSAIFH